MKLTIFVCLLALAAAAPQTPDHLAETLVDERHDAGDGNFNYNFETSNRITERRLGYPGSEGQSNMEGSFSFFLPDGTQAVFNYVADEGGYVPESPLIPVPPPLPPHALEQIALRDQLVAQGATWNEQGFRITK